MSALNRSRRRLGALVITTSLIGSGLAVALIAAPAEATSSDVVITEVYGGGGNSGAPYTNDFIELTNNSTAPVDVSGWSVQYAAAAGTTWQVTPLSGCVQPGTYYLVREAQGAGGTTPLPTPDAIGTIPMSATSGKVLLATTTTPATGTSPAAGITRDFVGYGAANAFEGSGPAPTLSNTTAALRGNGEAARYRREIAAEMSDADIAVAQRAARDWLRTSAQGTEQRAAA